MMELYKLIHAVKPVLGDLAWAMKKWSIKVHGQTLSTMTSARSMTEHFTSQANSVIHVSSVAKWMGF